MAAQSHLSFVEALSNVGVFPATILPLASIKAFPRGDGVPGVPEEQCLQKIAGVE